jgi:hypothetical protein
VPSACQNSFFTAGQDDVKEAAERILTERTIRASRDAWRNMHVADDLDRWCLVGAALNIGRQWALKVTGANRPAGGMYSRAMGKWCAENHFGQMAKTARSYALAIFEHAGEIEQWRQTLPERQQRLGGLRLLRRWRRQTQAVKPRYDDTERARAAWRRFISCVRSLPPDQAMPLWQIVLAEATQSCLEK